MLNSHLTVLNASAALYPSCPAFKTPCLGSSSNTVEEWRSISYAQFQADVESSARHWTKTFRESAIPRRSVIGLWYVDEMHIPVSVTNSHNRIGGFTYTDVLHIYGISRAGFIPQLFSLRLPNPDIIYELLERANAKGLVYDSSICMNLGSCPVPTFSAMLSTDTNASEPLCDLDSTLVEDDIAFIFHTSGSTSGSPKLVPCSYRWLAGAVHKSHQVSRPRTAGRRDVTVWM